MQKIAQPVLGLSQDARELLPQPSVSTTASGNKLPLTL